MYGNKKKKPGFGGKDDDKDSVQASTPGIQSPALTVSDLPEAAPSPVTAPPDSVKSDWDAESEDEKPSQDPEPAKADVRSDWDATSSDEEGKKPAPAPAKAAPTKCMHFFISYNFTFLIIFNSQWCCDKSPYYRGKQV